MMEITHILDRLAGAAPTAFLGVIMATVVTYMMFKVRITEQRRIREIEEQQLNQLKKELESLQQQIKTKDEKIQTLHEQIIAIATGGAPKQGGKSRE